MVLPVYLAVKDVFETKGLPAVFQEVLGWDSPSKQTLRIQIGGRTFEGQLIASLIGTAAVICFSTTETLASTAKRAISMEVGTRFPERLVGFESHGTTTWLWPKRTSSGSQTYEHIDVPSAIMPTFFAQRLAGLQFTVADHTKGISPLDLKNKLRGAFDTSKVTKKFYDGFQLRHKELAAEIKGLPEDQAASYASVLLNRLMFIYFLQKKEFLNLDPDYLRTSLTKLQALNKKDSFYSFYRDLLLELFFHGLNDQEQKYSTPEIADIIGKVPYVNGGIFEETEIEKVNDIEVPDSVFESIFSFFDSFTWHLDTRPTGNPEEINPEVIGYIFEQYINFTSNGKKENGAYYTKQDVTGYMVTQTVVPRLLDQLERLGQNPMKLLNFSGTRYLRDSQIHGWDFSNEKWLKLEANIEELWRSEPDKWVELDQLQTDPEICLTGESWVEALNRRDQVDEILRLVETNESFCTNDLITHNLDGTLLLIDAISRMDDDASIETFWTFLTRFSVIDPTCGSGAFLFSALELLEEIYSATLGIIQDRAAPYAIALNERVSIHANRRYFIRKQIALNNLFGTDLMADAIETAKLRIFLALAACLESHEDIEPLPDLDFNLKTGNLIVGLHSEVEASLEESPELFSSLDENGLKIRIQEYIALYKAFLDASEKGDPQVLKPLKDVLNSNGKRLRFDANAMFGNQRGLRGLELDSYLFEKKPFHWFVEFPQIIARGGFDAVVGNPPYVKASDCDRADFIGYQTRACPDLYAICYERSLQLLHPEGRLSLVVMASFAIGDKFEKLREIVYQNRNVWTSTFDRIPDGLFTPARVRNAITILGPGQSQMTSIHNIFSSATRAHLFTNLRYFESPLMKGRKPNRGGVARNLIKAIDDAELIYPERKTAFSARRSGGYWLPVLYNKPNIIDGNGNATDLIDETSLDIYLARNENKNLAIAVLGSKLGYLWWACTGDSFNFSADETIPVRSLVSQLAREDPELNKLAESVRAKAKGALFCTQNAKASYLNLRWPSLSKETDALAFELLGRLGLDVEWRNLNILYRQLMKSSGESNRARAVTAAQGKQTDLL